MRNGDLLLLPRSVRPVVICSVNADSITYSFPRPSLTPRAFFIFIVEQSYDMKLSNSKAQKRKTESFLLDLRVTALLRKKKKENHNYSYKEGDLNFLEIHQKNAKISARKEILLLSQQSQQFIMPLKN